ncbi:hypothetical protein [Stappia sp. MMSF_3263]|uniref:hypothetical protein n=1 Tax=Stappia sp. MMSF_3263 TaxID=3046693 RepID=UPI00273E142C|nr:hypothetical protein [Stappia sp. MMSF_3263]
MKTDKTFLRVALLLSIPLILAGCGPSKEVLQQEQELFARAWDKKSTCGNTENDAPAARAIVEKDRLRGLTRYTVGDAPEVMSDRTHVSYMPGHGTQISYTSADGRSWLWYPGNPRILQGRWKLDDSKDYLQVCYNYGPGTRNPMMKDAPSGFQCGNFVNQQVFALDTKRGDVFGLATAKVLKPLPRDAAKPYSPGCAPARKPLLKSGNPPIENLQKDLKGSLAPAG